ncbi:class I SAM-dependent DNA methyltransferase [Actinacidiphila alni]|uniref:class I SAM-dependent DNA methyltransferase n=1 Tax=Actinacidiphila alni TaxID=380248 RepID=UPI0034512EA5
MSEPDFIRTARISYDTLAADYADGFRTELDAKPLERAMLAAFAELVRAGGGGPVADIGCGPGHVTAHLRRSGLDAFGIDLSPGMIAAARRDHPGLRFEVGSMTGLDLPDGGLGGIVAMYSVIHLPTDRLPAAFAEFHRVLAARGLVLLTFQVGDQSLHKSEMLGRDVDLDYYWRRPETLAAALSEAGFDIVARLVREPVADVEAMDRACLIARKRG